MTETPQVVVPGCGQNRNPFYWKVRHWGAEYERRLNEACDLAFVRIGVGRCRLCGLGECRWQEPGSTRAKPGRIHSLAPRPRRRQVHRHRLGPVRACRERTASGLKQQRNYAGSMAWNLRQQALSRRTPPYSLGTPTAPLKQRPKQPRCDRPHPLLVGAVARGEASFALSQRSRPKPQRVPCLRSHIRGTWP